MKAIRKNWIEYWPFALYLVFLLLMFSKVYIYYDDFGYLSLSYGYEVTAVQGDNFNFPQLLQFIKEHYQAANGRLLYTFLYLFSYWLGGLRGTQCAMALIVFAVTLLLYHLVKSKRTEDMKHSWLFSMCFVLLYGSIGVLVQRHAAYWFAASFVYITPAVFFLLFVNCYCMLQEKRRRVTQTVLLCILAFFSGFSQEQWIVATLAAVLLIWGWRLIAERRRISWGDICIFLSVAAGGSVIFTSPALSNRLSNAGNAGFMEMSWIRSAIEGTKKVLGLFAGEQNTPYIYIFCGFMFLLSLIIYEKMEGCTGWKRRSAVFACVMTLAGLFPWNLTGKLYFLFWIIYLSVSFVLILYYLYLKRDLLGGVLILSAICSLGCMIMVPELPTRALIPFELISFYLFGHILLDLLNRKEFYLSVLISSFFMIICGGNLYRIYWGYAENYQVLKQNEAVIEQTVKQYEANPKKMQMMLQTQPEYIYGSDMMYLEDFAFMEGWVRQYYEIPEEIEIIYYAP